VAAGEADLSARLPLIREQLGDLDGALRRLLAGCRDGTKRFKTYRELKLYGSPGDRTTTVGG
jgi:hypothetical protein